MKRWRPALAPGVVVENVGDQTLALVGNPPQVVRLSQEASQLLTLIQHNPGNEVDQTAALGELADLGVVEDTSPSTLSRRGVIKLSAVAGAAGLSAVLLPTAAAASSTAPFTGTYALESPWWFFEIAQTDFPDADFTSLTGLTIGGTTYNGVTVTGGFRWQVGIADGPFAGPVVGTFSDLSLDPAVVYTVTFSPAV